MSQNTLKSLDDVWPIGKKSAYFTLFIAVLLAMFDFIDRQVLAALFPYLKAEFGFSDTQLGFIVSIVNISIAVLVIPSAYLIDRWSRKKMICLMGIIWSLATGACAFAGSYTHLLAARFAVGAGEAGYNPAAQSLLSASFPKRLRATVIAILQTAMGLGTPVGLVFGAYIAEHWGWRHAFGIVAIPGLFVALLALAIKDFHTTPAPKTAEPTPQASAAPARQRPNYIIELCSLLRKPTLLCVFAAQALMLIYQTALMNWLPSYFNRAAGMPVTEASNIAALCLLLSCFWGFASGPFLDWLRRLGPTTPARWQVLSCFIGFGLLGYVFHFATPGSRPQIVALLLSFPFMNTLPILGYTITNDLALPRQRATAISLLITVQNLFGMMIGPILTGFLSDTFDLATSMLLMASLSMVAGLFYLVISFSYPKELAKMPHEEVKFQ